MSAALDHTIVFVKDRQASAAFLSEILGAARPEIAGHFTAVHLDNGTTLDFMNSSNEIAVQHYAFLIDDAQFDAAFEKIRARQPYWADPYRSKPGQIGEHNGGRAIYFEEPSGHFLEVRTRPARST